MIPKIIYEDEDLLAINKPAGLLSVPGRTTMSGVCVHQILPPPYARTLIVHRLDQATSGIMVMAKHALAQKLMSKLFAAQRVKKRYVAVVAHHVYPLGQWQLTQGALCKDWANRPKQMISDSGKPSLTYWRALLHLEHMGASVLDVAPLTGRTHQIRVHLLSVGLPVMGDTLYALEQARDFSTAQQTDQSPGGPHTFSIMRCAQSLNPFNRMLLHARQIDFVHPLSHQPVQLICEPDFIDVSTLISETIGENGANEPPDFLAEQSMTRLRTSQDPSIT
jgi:tRNA pseudouridine32 synthase/23S rRNA pseudouridine746 synthase